MRIFLALAIAIAAAAASPPPASASCLRTTVAEQRARAHVIFDGVALDGPTAAGIQRFRVSRYRKGAGPRIVRVQTGYVRLADGGATITSVSIAPERGQRWRIFARGDARRLLRTNLCDGSRPL